jgi:hypothetical protein
MDINTDENWKIVWQMWQQNKYENCKVSPFWYASEIVKVSNATVVPGNDATGAAGGAAGKSKKNTMRKNGLYLRARADYNSNGHEVFDLKKAPPVIRALVTSDLTCCIQLDKHKKVKSGFSEAMRVTIDKSCRCCRTVLLDQNECLRGLKGDGGMKGWFDTEMNVEERRTQLSKKIGTRKSTRTKSVVDYKETSALQDDKQLR